MSDERDLTPEQEARVARLLADARHDEPMPDDVAARLDRVLAGMAGERIAGPSSTPAPVVDLAARRRRRTMSLLAAAAAVVVAGVGFGQLVGPQGGDDSDSGGTSQANDAPGPASGDAAAPERAESLGPAELEALGEPARITEKSFAVQVRKLQDRPGVRSYASDDAMMDGSQLTGVDFPCGPAEYGAGKLVAVRYNGHPAVLAYRPPSGETQVVDLLQCGSGEAIRSTTLPLP
jgi:hypothetical protein